VKVEKKTLSLALVCVLIGLLMGAWVGYAATPSRTVTITGGVFPGAPAYTISVVDGVYYAKDQNGYETSDTNASNLICSLLASNIEIQFEAGTYYITNPDGIVLDGLSGIHLFSHDGAILKKQELSGYTGQILQIGGMVGGSPCENIII
jgi:hypothetical protein